VRSAAARIVGFRWWRELGISELRGDNLGSAASRIRLRRVVLRDEFDHETRKEPPVEVAVVEFETRVTIADPAFETRVDRIAGNQHIGSRGQITRKNKWSIVAHRLSSACRSSLTPCRGAYLRRRRDGAQPSDCLFVASRQRVVKGRRRGKKPRTFDQKNQRGGAAVQQMHPRCRG
jgi:hypothetical protein